MLCHKELSSVQVLSHLNKFGSQYCSTLQVGGGYEEAKLWKWWGDGLYTKDKREGYKTELVHLTTLRESL